MNDKNSRALKKILSPSILAADHAALADGLKIVQDNALEWIHLDIMDGNFVPNISFGPGVVKALRSRDDKLFFDMHRSSYAIFLLTSPQEVRSTVELSRTATGTHTTGNQM